MSYQIDFCNKFHNLEIKEGTTELNILDKLNGPFMFVITITNIKAAFK